MPKISTYNTTSPKLDDKLIGTDTDSSNATKNFTIGDVIALAPGGSSSVQSLNTLVGALKLIAGTDIDITTNGVDEITISSNAGASGVESLNTLAGQLDIVAGNAGINVTTNASNQILISATAVGGNYLEDVFVTGGVAQLGVILTVPEGAVSLTNDFANTAKIIEVSFPSTLTSTSDRSFRNNLLTEVDVNNITNIGTDSFNYNPYLDTLNLRSVQTIGIAAFNATGFLSNGYDLVFPPTLTSVGGSAFNSSKINSVTFDAANQVTNLQSSTFANTSSFTSITLPSNLVTIGDQAFQNSDLTSIIVPNSVTSIGSRAFESSPLTSAVINNGTIGDYAFRSITTLTSLTLNSGVTSIGQQSFDNLGITTVTIPSTVTSMGNSAFASNSNLTSAIINSTVIGLGSFSNSPLLSTVTLSNNLLSIGSSAFIATGLTSITIPNTVTSLGTSSFNDTSLSSIVFDSVSPITDIPQACFVGSWENNRTVTTLTLPEAVQTFGSQSFQKAGIQTLAIPNTTTVIDQYAFYGQRYTTFAGTDPALDWTDAIRRGLDTLTFDATSVVTTIGNYAFEYNNISSLVIPPSVTIIGIDAFRYNNLTSIVLPATVTTVGGDSFSNNPNLTSVTINSTSSSTSNAFDNIATTITTVNIGPGVTASSVIFTGSTGIGTLDIAANAVTNSSSFNNLAIGTLTVDGTATINGGSFTNSTITLGTIGDGITLPVSAFNSVDFTTLNIGNTVTIGNSAFFASVITTLNIGNNLVTSTNSFDDVTIGTMTIGTDAEIVGSTFDTQSTITGDLTIGVNLIARSSAAPGITIGNDLTIGNTAGLEPYAFQSIDVNNIIIGNDANLSKGVFKNSPNILGNFSIGDNAVFEEANGNTGAFYDSNIAGNVTIGDNAILTVTSAQNNIGAFHNSSIVGNVTIGLNADIQRYSFYVSDITGNVTIGINSNIGAAAFYGSSSVIPVLTIGSGSTLEYQSFGSHTYSSFSLGNNLIFYGKVFQDATLTGDFTIDPTWTLIENSLDRMNIIGDFIVPNNEVLPISVFSDGSIDGDLVLGTGVTLPDNCFFSTDITGDLTIPISTVFTGNEHFELANIGTVNIPNNFVIVDQMFTNVTVDTMTLGDSITVPNLSCITGTITNMTVGDNLIGTFISQSPQVTNMTFGSNSNLRSSSGARYSNLTLGVNNIFEDSAFIDNEITNLIMPAPATAFDLHQFNGSQFFAQNNISSFPAYFSSPFVNSLPNRIFLSNAFSGNITLPSNILGFNDYCLSGNSITGLTNVAPGSPVIFAIGVFQNNNFSSIPDFMSDISQGIISPRTFEGNDFTSLTVDATNNYWIRKFDYYSFAENSSLTTLSFDAVDINHMSNFITNGVFQNCNISSVTFLVTGTGSFSTSTVTSNSVFKGNNLSALPTGLYGTGSVVGQSNIYYQTFMDNSFSGSLTIPDGVTTIGVQAFKDNNLTAVSVAAGTTIAADSFDPGVVVTFRP